MPEIPIVERSHSASVRWRTTAAVACNVLLAAVGARIGIPGVHIERVRAFLHAMPGGLLRVYDFLVGGGVSRAAIFAIGAVPYLQAKLYLYLARSVSSRIRGRTATARTRREVVRIGTVVLALMQSWGFARFLEGIPGAVADPGIGFVSRTVLLVTGGAIVVSWLAETIGDLAAADTHIDDFHRQAPSPATAEEAGGVDLTSSAPA